jgi:AraC-like DNA-binding protein
MQDTKDLLAEIKQHDKLAIKVSSDTNHQLTEEQYQRLLQPHRMAFYFFVFVEKGSMTYRVDINEVKVSTGELLFVLPNQIFAPPSETNNSKYYKIGFDENTLALLPQRFFFLMQSLSEQKVTFNKDARQRLKAVLKMLNQLLNEGKKQVDGEIILAHLNTFLTEVNSAYSTDIVGNKITDSKHLKYLDFQLAVESHLTAEHSVHSIAEKLAVSSSNLYGIVKEYAGISPKEFMTNRLMMEAQRRLRYSKTSVKELAYELGFNDPDYFSRLFKKSTGKSVSEFVENL